HPLFGLLDRRIDLLLAKHPDRLASQAFGDLHMVDAVAAGLRSVDVVESERHAVVHVEATLRLTYEAKVGIVDDYMQVRQLELRPDGELLDHELKIVVAGESDDAARRVGGTHAERGGNRPSERTGLTAVDPVARLVHMQELCGGDLREPDGSNVAGVVVVEG